MKDYYKILGVDRGASKQQIEKAHKALYIKNHPDRFKDKTEKQQKEKLCKDINEAYANLIDPEKRQRYDFELSRGRRTTSNNQGFNFQFDFSDYAEPSYNREPKKVHIDPDIQLVSKISLKDAFYGTQVQMIYKKYESCTTCKQTGMGAPTVCMQCGGRGIINAIITIIRCQSCNGAGKTYSKCRTCSGAGLTAKNVKATLIIPAKTHDKKILKFSAQGHKLIEGTGNLRLKVELVNSQGVSFDIQGNLYTEVNVKLSQVLQQAMIEVKLFNEIYPTQLPRMRDSRTKLTIPNKGLKVGDKLGNIIVSIIVHYPL